jgi:hypothetical protein
MATHVGETIYSVPVQMQEEKKKPVPAEYLQDYLEMLIDARSFAVSNLRNWSLIQCYAELQFKLNGGSKCPVCRACVRHVVSVHVEKNDGATQDYHCLCTRCFEAERATSKCVSLKLGDAAVKYTPREYGATSTHGKTANQIVRRAIKAAS